MWLDISRSIKKLFFREIAHKANVVGYSMSIRKRRKSGRVVDEDCVTIYVRKKLPLSCLSKGDIIPRVVYLEGYGFIGTDVEEIEEPRALVSKTSRIRPVPLGVSIGHWDITAGSLGMLFTKDGKLYAGSNAHVLTPNPSMDPSEVHERRILQPGAYHGGRDESNVVGIYADHVRIAPMGNACRVGSAVCSVLNTLARMLGRKGRFEYVTFPTNYLDFAVYEPTVRHVLDAADGSLSRDAPFIGMLFAGSDMAGIICKVEYMQLLGYEPLVEAASVEEGDTVKGCSFWCSYQTRVLDPKAAVTVSYGSFRAYFEDVIVVHNEGVIKGGWSGSGWRLIENA